MNDDQIRELFQEMQDDPVPADSLARVRQAVMARASRRRAGRGFGMIWKLAIPVALAGCIAAVLFRASVRRTAPVAIQPVAAIEEPAAVLQPQPQTPVVNKQAHATMRAARHSQVKPAPKSAGASVIRIETPDPGVVILLVADGGSGSSRGPVARE